MARPLRAGVIGGQWIMPLAIARLGVWMALACATLACSALASLAALAQPTFPPLAGQPVVDAAAILDEPAEQSLNQALLAFEQRTGRQLAIATIPDLQGYDIAEYGFQLGRAWGLGEAERNDGIILIVAPNERRMRIEVGYGLEGTMPDGLAFDIIEDMRPHLREGDYAAGIGVGAEAIIRHLELPPEEAALVAQRASQPRRQTGGVPVGGLMWLGILGFFFVVPALFGRRGRRYRGRGGGLTGAGFVGDILLWEAGKALTRGAFGGSDWGGGGDGGFGGGFGGGGGGFGGGGASGGW